MKYGTLKYKLDMGSYTVYNKVCDKYDLLKG